MSKLTDPTPPTDDEERLADARATLARVAPGGALRWTNAQRLEEAIRVIVRDEVAGSR